jgi:hypothetical protein
MRRYLENPPPHFAMAVAILFFFAVMAVCIVLAYWGMLQLAFAADPSCTPDLADALC